MTGITRKAGISASPSFFHSFSFITMLSFLYKTFISFDWSIQGFMDKNLPDIALY